MEGYLRKSIYSFLLVAPCSYILGAIDKSTATKEQVIASKGLVIKI